MKTPLWIALLLLIASLAPRVAGAAEPQAEVRITVTNQGEDVAGRATAYFFAAGKRDKPYLGSRRSGQEMRLPEGSYDVRLNFEDGAAKKELWLEQQQFRGKVERTVEIDLPLAEARIVVTNNGEDVRGKGSVYFYPAGKRGGPYVGWQRSGNPMRLAAGSYDVRIGFEEGSAKKELWLENQAFSGKVERSVEIGAPVAEVKVTVTNGGLDVGSKGTVYFYPAGRRNQPYAGWQRSGHSLALGAGAYDMQVRFDEWPVRKERWFENQQFSGKVELSVELGLVLAEVTIRATLDGNDLGDKAAVAWYEPGERSHGMIGSSSGKTLRMEEGTYDLRVAYGKGAERAEATLTGLAVQGRLERTVELRRPDTELTVKVLRAGKPLTGALCGAYPQGVEAGAAAQAEAGAPMRIAPGTYDIGCFYSRDGLSAEGWLRAQALAGKAERTIVIELEPASLTVTAGNTGAGAAGGDPTPNVEIVLDASGSMVAAVDRDHNRMEVARDVLAEVIRKLPEQGVNVALRVYGTEPKAKHDCRDSKLMVRRGPVDKGALLAAVERVSPSGYTPIAYNLEQAAADLPAGGNNALVLVTDGIESCNGDPCAAAAQLAAKGIVARSFVVGFGIGDDRARSLQCIGRYYAANDRAQLLRSLSEILAESVKPLTGTVTLYPPGNRLSLAARGDLGRKLVVPAGSYDVMVEAGGRSVEWNGVAIRGDLTRTLEAR